MFGRLLPWYNIYTFSGDLAYVTEFCHKQSSLCGQVLRSNIGSVTARHSSSGRQPNFAALNRGRQLYSAGRPSRLALIHILAGFLVCVLEHKLITLVIGLLVLCPHSLTRHRASTSTYSLTFCVRFLLPERHQKKPAVQAAAVMLRTPPSTANHRRVSHAHFAYTARNFDNAPRHPPVSGQQRAQTPPSRPFALCLISRDERKLITRVRVMLP